MKARIGELHISWNVKDRHFTVFTNITALIVYFKEVCFEWKRSESGLFGKAHAYDLPLPKKRRRSISEEERARRRRQGFKIQPMGTATLRARKLQNHG